MQAKDCLARRFSWSAEAARYIFCQRRFLGGLMGNDAVILEGVAGLEANLLLSPLCMVLVAYSAATRSGGAAIEIKWRPGCKSGPSLPAPHQRLEGHLQ